MVYGSHGSKKGVFKHIERKHCMVIVFSMCHQNNKYACCSVNSQVFSSNFNSTDTCSIVKALFALTDQLLHPYFGVVNFFFEVDAMKLEHVHLLMFFGLNFVLLQRSLFHNSIIMVKKTFYSDDHIISPRLSFFFFFLSRCVLLSPYKSESYYFTCEFPKYNS